MIFTSGGRKSLDTLWLLRSPPGSGFAPHGHPAMPADIFGCPARGQGASEMQEAFVSSPVTPPASGGDPQDPPGVHPVLCIPLTRPQLPIQGRPTFFAEGALLWPVPEVSAGGGVVSSHSVESPRPTGANAAEGGHSPILNPSQSPCIFKHGRAHSCPGRAFPLLH